FRSSLIKAHARFSFFALHTSPSPKVFRGKERWLFYNGQAARDGDTLADFRGVPPLTTTELERWRWAFQDQHDWLTAHGIQHLIALIPAKETIYPDFMPDRYTRHGPPAIEQVAAYLRAKTDIPLVDTTPALRAARERVLAYHPNDTHWNAFGAYIGYRTIMDGVARIFPACVPRPEEDFVREELVGLGGDLAQMINLGDRLTQHYVFMNPRFATNAVFTWLADDEMADLITDTGLTNLPRVAILRDSFTEAMRGYLAEHFHRAHFQWARTGFDGSLLQRVDPQLVIQIIADRAFRKGRRYPVAMHHESIARRFARADAAPRDPPVWEPVEGTTRDGATLAHASAPPTLLTPAPADQETVLVIQQWTVVSDRPRDLIATWTSAVPDDRGNTERRAPPFPLTAGTNTVYLSLVDPDIQGPVRLQWGRHPGTVNILDVQARGIPR
ncbi:MAG TPA: hypothetical protein PKE33_13020, partial [Kiritimatiellia bacterium]|nr:hypothetical protein [Kiritimatiellia bacterium]